VRVRHPLSGLYNAPSLKQKLHTMDNTKEKIVSALPFVSHQYLSYSSIGYA